MHIKRGQLPRKTGIVRKEDLEKIKPIEQRINEKKYFYIRTIKQLLEYPYRWPDVVDMYNDRILENNKIENRFKATES